MVSAHVVAAYVLGRCGRMSAMKLQKLVYYAQAWALVWTGEPLFGERIEAWAKGPVVRDLYANHRGRFEVDRWPWGDPGALDERATRVVDAVLDYYGSYDADFLSDLTHRERPWREARSGVAERERSRQEITPAMMRAYYASLA